MKYVLVVHDEVLSLRDSEPFITMRGTPTLYILGGLIVFGPYESLKAASDAGRGVDDTRFSWQAIPLETLSERVDNPGKYLMFGDDSPE